MIEALCTALALAFLSPLAAFGASAFVEGGRRRRAYRRLASDPLVRVGATIERLEIEGLPHTAMRDCRIVEFGVGRMAVRDARGAVMTFTGREFERLHPVFAPPEERS